MLTNPVPFGRLDDWFGLWAYEPEKFELLRAFLSRVDYPQHYADFQRPKAAVQDNTVQTIEGKGGKSIAVIQLTGTLMKAPSSFGGTSTIRARQQLRAATRDPNISGILVAIDSPGGTVSGTADLAGDVKAARKVKPVFAQIDDLGASAAYWVASQAGAVFANAPTALVGSIGTMQQVVDTSGKAERDGIKVMTFSTGPLKSIGGDAGVTDEQKQYMQALVNAAQQSFDASVQTGRRLSDSKLAAVKSGAVFLAEQAQQLGLIDGVQSMDATIKQLVNAK